MFIAKTLSFYKRRDVRNAMLKAAENKEISVRFNNYFGKRPEVLLAPGDILEFAMKKATSFHVSEETWDNPLLIKTGMSQKDISDLRTGWDLILDIDCPYWPLSKLITHLLIKAIKAHNIKAISVKFSGNKGFHIGVPFESFPQKFQSTSTKDLFPEAPRRIAYYLLDYITKQYIKVDQTHFIFDNKFKIGKEKLLLAMGIPLNDHDKKITYACAACGYQKEYDDVPKSLNCPRCAYFLEEQSSNSAKTNIFNPLNFIEVDTILIAHRHLYRMPYSLHEKSHLVSLPINIDEVLAFSKGQAEPTKVDFSIPFLDRSVAIVGEATNLLVASYDFEPKLAKTDLPKKEFEIPSEAIPEKLFPPCIKGLLEGLKDGRKRAMFTLINFLKGCGWSHEQIDERLREWNKVNDEPLREVNLKGQLRYAKQRKEILPPHNCKRYYQDLAVCKPDTLCAKIKNPLQYAKRKAQMVGGKGGRPKLTEEQKEMRRKFREKQKAKKKE